MKSIYTISRSIPIWGTIGCVFFGYVILGYVGLLDPILFPALRREGDIEWNLVLLFLLFMFGCILLITLVRLRVQVSDEGVHYKGLLSAVMLRWDQVIRIEVQRRTQATVLVSHKRRIRVDWIFGNCRRFKEEVRGYANMKAIEWIEQ
ncbi:MAG: hypothetical protein AABZ47_12875 [Planctomycetota bacterium]